MSSFPLPIRVAAGLAAVTAEQTRRLPGQLAGLPVTVVSQTLQCSMRVQQQVTELAIRGDAALDALRGAEEQPAWATFDEDAADGTAGGSGPEDGGSGDGGSGDGGPGYSGPGYSGPGYSGPGYRGPEDGGGDGDVAADGSAGAWRGGANTAAEPPGPITDLGERPAVAADLSVLPEFDQLTLPQLRGRLRGFSEAELVALLDHERAHGQRPDFLRMLENRLERLRQR